MELEFSDGELINRIENLFLLARDIFGEGYILSGYISRNCNSKHPFDYDFKMQYTSDRYADRQNHEVTIVDDFRHRLNAWTDIIMGKLEKRIGGAIQQLEIIKFLERFIFHITAPVIRMEMEPPSKIDIDDEYISSRFKNDLGGADIKSIRLLPIEYKFEVVPAGVITMVLLPEGSDDIIGVIPNNRCPYVFFRVKTGGER